MYTTKLIVPFFLFSTFIGKLFTAQYTIFQMLATESLRFAWKIRCVAKSVEKFWNMILCIMFFKPTADLFTWMRVYKTLQSFAFGYFDLNTNELYCEYDEKRTYGGFIVVTKDTAWKVSVSGVSLVRIFPHSYWIRRYTEYLSLFSPNAGKYGPEKLRVRTLFTQWKWNEKVVFMA